MSVAVTLQKKKAEPGIVSAYSMVMSEPVSKAMPLPLAESIRQSSSLKVVSMMRGDFLQQIMAMPAIIIVASDIVVNFINFFILGYNAYFTAGHLVPADFQLFII